MIAGDDGEVAGDSETKAVAWDAGVRKMVGVSELVATLLLRITVCEMAASSSLFAEIMAVGEGEMMDTTEKAPSAVRLERKLAASEGLSVRVSTFVKVDWGNRVTVTVTVSGESSAEADLVAEDETEDSLSAFALLSSLPVELVVDVIPPTAPVAPMRESAELSLVHFMIYKIGNEHVPRYYSQR